MATFTAETSELKKALSVVRLGAGEAAESIHSHALFILKENRVILYATDEDKIALSNFLAESPEKDSARFTANPKRIQDLISDSDKKRVKFTYDEKEKTLNVYASEDDTSFLSFASFEPDEFLTFNKELKQREVIKKVNADVFLSCLRFAQGYLPGDDKDKKYTNLFINEGAIYGSNGNTKVGGFKTSELDDIKTLALRKTMLSSIIAMIDKTGMSNVIIKASDKFVTFSSEDNAHCFGFRKPNVDMPKLPIAMQKPETTGFTLDHKVLLKKLKRLSLASWESIGVKVTFEKDNLLIQTITDRVSQERMPCKHISGEDKAEFNIECNPLRDVLSLFKAADISMFIDTKKCVIYSEADVVIEEEGKDPVKHPFTAVGFRTLARVID